ncbi:MAG TPA: hypothetical protein VFT51_03660 [Bacillales bacterium]|nr:hypothetical protein [Bacillales bacterium]
MKNVVIHKITKYVFTEGQMKSAWKHSEENLDFASLSENQLMALASNILEQASHSDLEHHTLDSAWRTKRDFEGKMIAENDSDPGQHVELIDTEQEGTSADVFIDRMLRVKCSECDFEFFIEDLDYDLSTLKCPKDGGAVKIDQNTEKRINRN